MIQNKVIVIAGIIGSGKTEVCNILRTKGYSVYTLDEINEELLLKKHVKNNLVKILGNFILDDNMEIDKEGLSKIIFNNPSSRIKVEEFLHKEIMNNLTAKIKMKKNHKNNLLFVEIPLFFTKYDFIKEHIDIYKVWVLSTDKDVCISRVKKRNNFSEDKILKIMDLQYNNIDIEEPCVFFKNDKDLCALKQEVENAILMENNYER